MPALVHWAVSRVCVGSLRHHTVKVELRDTTNLSKVLQLLQWLSMDRLQL